MLYAHDARDHSLKAFLYSEVKTHAQQAFRASEVAALLGCVTQTIRQGTFEKRWPEPQKWYKNFDENGQRWYSEDDVRYIREVMAETSIGRPREDGIVVVRSTLPSAEELEAALRSDEVLYVKDGDEFVPVWKAKF